MAPPRQPSPGHQRLAAFLGTWTTEGRQLEGPIGPAAPITAIDTYEWLEGGFFMIHRFEGKVGDGSASCIEIIGHDPEAGTYPVYTFYNDGMKNEWTYRVEGRTWTLDGQWPDPNGGDAPMPVRCTLVLSEAGDTMDGTWASSPDDGQSWQTFWEVHSRRTPSASGRSISE